MIKILPQIILGVWGILPGNYSGITHIMDSHSTSSGQAGSPAPALLACKARTNMYAVVDDKDTVDGFKLLTLDIDSVTGQVRHASMEEPSGMKERRAKGVSTDRDCEGVAYFPEANTVFVSGEEDQRIMEYSIDGVPTGRELQIPSCMTRDKIVTNLGFEALTYNDNQKRFWTTTEAALPTDPPYHLRFVSFDTTLQPVETFVYVMDKPTATKKNATCIHGVPSLLALDDGRLIVMEREGCFPKHEYGSWVKIKLYVVDPRSLSRTQDPLKKELLCQFTTHLRIGQMNLSNYEGMCLGPKLKDGCQTIILIADSQNGLGNWLYHVKDHIRIIKIP